MTTALKPCSDHLDVEVMAGGAEMSKAKAGLKADCLLQILAVERSWQIVSSSSLWRSCSLEPESARSWDLRRLSGPHGEF